MSFFVGPSAVSAQEGPDTEIVVDGSQATVTVVAADLILPGSAPPRSVPNWSYVCRWWEDTLTNPNPTASPTTNPRPGFRYFLNCTPTPGSGLDSFGSFVVYDPADPIPGIAVITSLEIRDFVRDQGLVQPEPLAVGISPGPIQITGVETWLWPDGSIDRIRASANAGGLTVTVEARYQQTVFDMDEEGVEQIVCTKQIAWEEGLDVAGCSHTYFTEAAARTITAASDWDFVWWDSASQPVPVFWETITLDEQFDVQVVDLEAVITGSR